LLTPEGAS